MKIKPFLQKIVILLSALSLLFSVIIPSSAEEPSNESEESRSPFAAEEGSLKLNCKSAILMEETTGAILYTQNAHEALPPASVTKIMTLLLVMESLEAGTLRHDDVISVSANAASMGGSQVYLKEGERMSVEDLLKSVVIASANDAAVALAETVAGSVSAFVDRMNTRARQLGMTDTAFENVTGLDDTATNHLTSAQDIAIMSKELIRHKEILEYSSIWMDTIRDGAFGLTNTNRLVRFYDGCTGLKTGSTSKAGFCISATAKRDNLSLICVIMGAESRDIRNAAASTLLDWGFANYGLYSISETTLDPIPVKGSAEGFCTVACDPFACVLPKGDIGSVEIRTNLPKTLSAPLKSGDPIGCIEFFVKDTEIGNLPVYCTQEITRINFFQIFRQILAKLLLI